MRLEELFEKEHLPSVKTPSAKALAKMHNCSLEEVQKQIKRGTEVELEHTKDVKKADEIARDHIKEDLHYYDHLEKMEQKFHKEK